MDRKLVTALLHPHAQSTPWNEALSLMTDVLKRAQCPPEICGAVVGELIAHKAKRDRAKQKAAMERQG